MRKEVIGAGKDVTEAQENARIALGAGPLDDIQYEVIYAGKKGFLGFMSKPAQVKAYIETPDKEEKVAVKDEARLYIDALEKEIRKRIGRKIKISSGKKAHKVEIEYTDDRDLEALLKLIAGEDIFD